MIEFFIHTATTRGHTSTALVIAISVISGTQRYGPPIPSTINFMRACPNGEKKMYEQSQVQGTLLIVIGICAGKT